ncbi:MAG: Gfo/Idh/MocA family oxidoreductase [Planctomycetota bacterium]|nr:Gfo/Idh/MocA family oxidoreductase [Planctomycetota bacterium]
MNERNRKTTRRDFLKAAGLAVAAPYVIPSSALAGGAAAPSERIAIGLIGAGNINTNFHMNVLLGCADARIVGVADPFTDRRQRMRDTVNKRYGQQVCTDHADFREMLARPDVDAVCIGTPDHWHALHAVTAMKAGKDVYVEKPMTHTIAEGRILADTAAAYGRVLQVGIQQRSDGNFRFACELARNGRVGKLQVVKVGVVGINGDVQAGKSFPTQPVPAGFDYDMWQGPAAVRPYCPERVHRGDNSCYWYYISDYTIGFLSGWGVHHVDIAQWGMGMDHTGPVEVHCTSATIPPDGLIDDVIYWTSECTYANGLKMIFSSNNNPVPQGIRFEGDEGWVWVDRGRLDANPKSLLKSVIGPSEIHLYESPEHHRNWLDCIRSRKPTAATAEIGHRATSTCNLVEVAARLGRTVKWDPAKERFIGDDQANRLLSKAMRAPWSREGLCQSVSRRADRRKQTPMTPTDIGS